MSEAGFDALMHDACVVWGFCGCIKDGEPLHVTQLIPPSGPVHATQFVEWLLLADNVNPNLPKYERHKAALRASFLTHMGSEIVDASLFRWSDCEPEAKDWDTKYRSEIRDPSDGS
jgi:hypothetical protein